MANRLAESSSPYLLQHKDNPVDWWPWTPEAFDAARTQDKPVFLSIGYSSCHWCHVMAHESFEDVGVARVLNESFISIKVDREELPDVDETYMTAVQLASGRGGWPMTIFMTPDKMPFLAATYLPRDDRGGHPGFLTIAANIAKAWKTRRAELVEAARSFAGNLAEVLSQGAPEAGSPWRADLAERAVRALAHEFDPAHAGFGAAPKFPPHSTLAFLLEYASWSSIGETAELALAMASATLHGICLGGVCDHIGGGFHRYSTDARWLLPHFEKMLYDNALMLGNLAHAERLLRPKDEELAGLFSRRGRRLLAWLDREMRTDRGLYASAIDADSQGEEGRFYVWSYDEVADILGHRAPAFLDAYGFSREGNFRDEATGRRIGMNIPNLSRDDASRFDDCLDLLLIARERRNRPQTDGKMLVSWNALLAAELARSGQLSRAREMVAALLEAEERYGRLPHLIADAGPAGEGYLDDYAFLCWALICVDEAGQGGAWRKEAQRLASEMASLFEDESGGMHYTSARHEVLFGRTKPYFDNPVPSGNAIACRVFARLGDAARAGRILEAGLGWAERAPGSTGALLLAAFDCGIGHGWADIVLFGDKTYGEVVLRIPQGMHVNAGNPAAVGPDPLLVEFIGVEGEAQYPPTAGGTYTGEVRVPIRLGASDPLEDARVSVSYQPCSGSECLPRRTESLALDTALTWSEAR